jgi:hypothetical protein
MFLNFTPKKKRRILQLLLKSGREGWYRQKMPPSHFQGVRIRKPSLLSIHHDIQMFRVMIMFASCFTIVRKTLTLGHYPSIWSSTLGKSTLCYVTALVTWRDVLVLVLWVSPVSSTNSNNVRSSCSRKSMVRSYYSTNSNVRSSFVMKGEALQSGHTPWTLDSTIHSTA